MLQRYEQDYLNRLTLSAGQSGSESLPIFVRPDKGLDHLGIDEVAVELVQLVQPEVIAIKVQVRSGAASGFLRR